ncbi:hypothetical protein [Ralstonia sp. Ralssp135]|uniref:hypothetical protein n=1 Tax=Ralstonia sp. Ralssp135 TaxID=3243016 RepID=UPI0039B094F0
MTNHKERPILFSGAMVRSILDGRKTQTRRLFKTHAFDAKKVNSLDLIHVVWGAEAGFISCKQPVDTAWAGFNFGGSSGGYFPCPYGQPGDRLWVRETARCAFKSEQPPDNRGCIGVEYQAGGSMMRDYALDRPNEFPWFPNRSHNVDGSMRWAPAIHVPRWASRILLEITDVRIERLNDCSSEDAIAEGISPYKHGWERRHPDPNDTSHSGATADPQLAYKGLWESINGTGSWDANPWVWVVEFRRVEA